MLGGELELTRFKDMPMDGTTADGEKIMNSRLETDDVSFMASDSGLGEVVMGNGVSLAISGQSADEAKLRGFFDGLSEGGKVTLPLTAVPWGALFGMFTDKFEIDWMFNIENEAPAAA